MKLWLADLTYTQQTIASDTFPAAVGSIGAFVKKRLTQARVRLFKYPEELAKAFEEDRPDVMGFSNYVWNAALSYRFAQAVKKHSPRTIVIMGGPNFPTERGEQEELLRAHPEIDFYVVKEAETAVAALLESLDKRGLDLRDEAGLEQEVPNLAFVDRGGAFRASPRLERVRNLAELPSPYVNGDLDAFFDGKLLPILQTNRGCPFACSFCTEGQTYWSKVSFKPEGLIRAELEYVARKLSAIPAEARRGDLLIADSNFGMYRDDLTTCKVIREVQEKHDYPKYINVATGKNKKEQVLEAAKLVNGAMKLAGSVQSLDAGVLTNIKRDNISAEQIVELAMKAAQIGTNTYSEVILALPGDSLEAHFKTLETLVDAGFNTISMYQLMILPGTEMGTRESKQRHRMRLKYRVVPRCFGSFRFLGEEIVCAEIEEICVSNATLPYEDYLKCRRMNLIVNVFYNDGIFAEIIRLIKLCGLSPWRWLEHVYAQSRSAAFEELVAEFLKETEGELWESRQDLEGFTRKPDVIARYIRGELGSNLIFKYKALSMTSRFDCVMEVAARTLDEFLAAQDASFGWRGLARDILKYNRHRVAGIFSGEEGPRSDSFEYDAAAFALTPDPGKDPERFRLKRPARLVFAHTPQQKAAIRSYLDLFGADTPGLTRILSRVFLKQLMRRPAAESGAAAGQEEGTLAEALAYHDTRRRERF